MKQLLISLLLVLLCLKARAQCIQDYYGFWQATNGNYIELFRSNQFSPSFVHGELSEPNRNIVSINKTEYKCSLEFNGKYVKLHAYANREKGTPEFNFLKKENRKLFIYRVLYVDKQLIKVLPVSKHMIEAFGEKEVQMFNELYLPVTSVRFDSIYFNDFRNDLNFGINLINGSMVKRRSHVGNRSYKYIDLYTSKLDDEGLEMLKKFIIQSEIIKLSICKLEDNCTCCSPTSIDLYFNGRKVQYTGLTYKAGKGMEYLRNRLLDIGKFSRWKWIGKVDRFSKDRFN